MDADKTVTTNFSSSRVTLTTTPVPAAGGTVTGAGTYDAGTVVTVNALPAAGYGLDNWSGDCSGTGTCSVTMDADKAVTAHFGKAAAGFTLTTNPIPSAGGTVVGGGNYDADAVATVTAAPNAGYAFDNLSLIHI